MATYGGRNSFRAEKVADIQKGDTANSLSIYLSNHAGTHLDFPSHVLADGRNLDDYPASYFIFHYPAVIKVTPGQGRYITADDIKKHTIPQGTDLLLIQTGATYDNDSYWRDNPGLAPSAAEYIKNLQPTLRCVGLDCISVNAWHDRDPGRVAHRILLQAPEVLILEDMDLSPLNEPGFLLSKVVVAPLRLAGADGTPATVFANLDPRVEAKTLGVGAYVIPCHGLLSRE